MKKCAITNERGFTLLEVIIVIAIMVIVMQVVFMSTSALNDNKKDQSITDMDRNINNALITYYSTMGFFPAIDGIEEGQDYKNIGRKEAEQMIIKIQQVTGITISKEYSYDTYKMNVNYANPYVMKISFEKR